MSLQRKKSIRSYVDPFFAVESISHCLQEMAAANAPQEVDDSDATAWKQASGEERPVLPSKISEVARFGALKERKHSLEAGIALFNR